MNLKSLLLLFSLLILSCKPHDRVLYEFDPRKLNVNEFNLSEIADDIAYIPLDNKYLLGHLIKIEFNDTLVYIGASNLGILVYNKEGKFIRKIGSVGRGPGEYTSNNSFTIDNETGKIYNMDLDGKIKVYSNVGLFIRSIPLLENDVGSGIAFYNNLLIVMYSIQYDNAKYRWIAFDTLGNVIKSQERKYPIFKANIGSTGQSYRFSNNIFYWNHYLDTVFSISSDLAEVPSFIISPGEHRLPKSQVPLEQIVQGYYAKFFLIHKIFETSRYFVVYYHYKRLLLAFINKHNQEVFLFHVESNDSAGNRNAILNDLDNGSSFFPENYFTEDGREYLLGLQYPYQIKARVASDEFRNAEPKYPEKKKELEKLATSLKETDNPVLVLVRLKK